MYSAMPCATRRTDAYVKSSAITPRQPSVPNLISGSGTAFRVTGLQVLGFSRPPKRLDHAFHVLRPRPRALQTRVLGGDDDHVLEPYCRDQTAVTEHHAVARVYQGGLAFDRVAAGVGPHPLRQLRPVADVRPLELGRYQQKPVGLLHHAAVDDLDRQLRIELRRRLQIACIPRLDHLAEAFHVARRVPLELLDENRQQPREPGQVPVVAAGFQETPRGGAVRLLDGAG